MDPGQNVAAKSSPSYRRNGVESIHFARGPLALLRAPVWNRELLGQLIKRDVLGRYRGSLLGLMWSFLNPFLMLAAYTLVFGVFLGAKWAGTSSTLEFSVVLYVGLILFSFLAECINRAPTLVTGQPNYVKKIIFPLELLPWAVVGAALFHALIGILVWCAFHLAVFGSLRASVPMVLLVLIPLALIGLGVTYLVAAAGVYLRDIAQMTTIVVPMIMFLSPIFYSVATIPQEYRFLLEWNPLTFLVESARGIMLSGSPVDWLALGRATAGSMVFAWLGFAWFQHAREGFADVM